MAVEVLVGWLGSDFAANPVVQALAVGVVRSVAGFLENIAGDGKVSLDEFRWSKLVETFLRVLPQALGALALGAPVEAALLSDFVVGAVKKRK